MNEVANTRTGGMTVLEDLAVQAQMFSTGAAMNLLQLGRVLTEAKPMVARGEWAAWVKENAHMPIRTAQQYMQAYQEFGLDQRYAQLGTSKVIKLLPMSEEEREELLRENDLEKMSVREVERAVQEMRGKIGDGGRAVTTCCAPGLESGVSVPEEIGREREALRAERGGNGPDGSEGERAEAEEIRERIRAEAEAQAERAEEELKREREALRAEMDREREALRAETEREREAMRAEALAEALAEAEREREALRAEVMEDAKEAIQEAMEAQRRLSRENADLQKENREQAEMLSEQQEELNRTQAELLNARSAMAKGDAERIPTGGLTVDGFAQAVRSFIGAVARMPQMRNAFAGMDHGERQEYEELLGTVEKWCADSRRAMGVTFAEGEVS